MIRDKFILTLIHFSSCLTRICYQNGCIIGYNDQKEFYAFIVTFVFNENMAYTGWILIIMRL